MEGEGGRASYWRHVACLGCCEKGQDAEDSMDGARSWAGSMLRLDSTCYPNRSGNE